MTAKIVYEHFGIVRALRQKVLHVPLNQREYSWEEEQVQQLLQDLSINKDSHRDYFLGTIVLNKTSDGDLEVSDGQQRLATVTMIVAAIRDYFRNNGDVQRAASIEIQYLFDHDIATDVKGPKLRLNVDDNAYFSERVLEGTGGTATRASHRRIDAAATTVAEHLAKLMDVYKEETRPGYLGEWLKYLTEQAEVIVLTVLDEVDAFTMFETLNDRGLKASQADLVKNYLLSRAGTARLSEAQQRWARMLGAVESLSISDIVMQYLRHAVVCSNGPTRSREILSVVKRQVTGQAKALSMLSHLADEAPKYCATFSSSHEFWNPYTSSVKDAVQALNDLQVEQIRPLVFAVLQRFELQQVAKAMPLFVSWSVRFQIAGGHRGGVLDENYGKFAREIIEKKIKTVLELSAAIEGIVPNDVAFEQAFKEAKVSKSNLARYYLRALEDAAKGPSDSSAKRSDVVNLEHIMPEVLGEGWKHIPQEVGDAWLTRIGNLALIQAKANVDLGNRTFIDKKETYRASGLLLTKMIAEQEIWGTKQIEDRQAAMARHAVKAWPIKS